MKDPFKLILGALPSLFKSRAKLEAEILILRQQIKVLRRRAPTRPHLNNTDRFPFVWLYHCFPSALGAIAMSGRRRSFAGIALGFERIGAGDRATMLADRRSRLSCARSLAR
jgi:hypothetical protein